MKFTTPLLEDLKATYRKASGLTDKQFDDEVAAARKARQAMIDAAKKTEGC